MCRKDPSRLLIDRRIDLLAETRKIDRRQAEDPLVASPRDQRAPDLPKALGRGTPVGPFGPAALLFGTAVTALPVRTDPTLPVSGDMFLDLHEMAPAIRTLLVAALFEPFVAPRRRSDSPACDH